MNAPPDLSDAFFVLWSQMCERLGIDPFDLIRVSFSEAGCRASAHNPSGNASGLIQFMPATLMGLGWKDGDAAFRRLSAEQQVSWVERYYLPYATWCKSDALCYVATFLPATGAKACEMGDQFVLCGQRGPLAWAYNANKVLDVDGDGAISVADLGARLAKVCVGARYAAIVERLRRAMGLEPKDVPEPAPTEPEIPCLRDSTPDEETSLHVFPKDPST